MEKDSTAKLAPVNPMNLAAKKVPASVPTTRHVCVKKGPIIADNGHNRKLVRAAKVVIRELVRCVVTAHVKGQPIVVRVQVVLMDIVWFIVARPREKSAIPPVPPTNTALHCNPAVKLFVLLISQNPKERNVASLRCVCLVYRVSKSAPSFVATPTAILPKEQQEIRDVPKMNNVRLLRVLPWVGFVCLFRDNPKNCMKLVMRITRANLPIYAPDNPWVLHIVWLLVIHSKRLPPVRRRTSVQAMIPATIPKGFVFSDAVWLAPKIYATTACAVHKTMKPSAFDQA